MLVIIPWNEHTKIKNMKKNQQVSALTKSERLAYLRERASLFAVIRDLTTYDYKYVYQVTRGFQYDKHDARAEKARDGVVFHDEVFQTERAEELARQLTTCRPFAKPLTNDQIKVLLTIRSLLRLQKRYGTSHIRAVKKLLEDHFGFPSVETLIRHARKEERIERQAFIASEKIRLARRFAHLRIKKSRPQPYKLDQAFINYICRPK